MTLKTFISFKEALDLTLSKVPLSSIEVLPLNDLTGRVLATKIDAEVDSPSVDSSKVDGYAVISEDLAGANKNNPVILFVAGSVTAGEIFKERISRGKTVSVTTGAPVPAGADAVIPEELCKRINDTVVFQESADPGSNVLNRGTDISKGETVAFKGQILSPAYLGLLAAAGLENAVVCKSPRVAVLATGDEVVVPGRPLPAGKLYASNMVEICSWLSTYGFSHLVDVLKDDKDEMKDSINRLLPDPEKGSACKRLNLFLRWMVRCDDVDPGGWFNISTSKLIIPLDTHIYRICYDAGFTTRKQKDLKTAIEITDHFKKYNYDDPVKYDFVLFRIGIWNKPDLRI